MIICFTGMSGSVNQAFKNAQNISAKIINLIR